MIKYIFILTILVLVLSACAGENASANEPNEKGKVAGFWDGLLHGFIAPITFWISLFIENVNIYEVHNSGGWYNWGFLMGLGAFSGGAASLRRRR